MCMIVFLNMFVLEFGLLLFGEDYVWVGVKVISGKFYFVYVQCCNVCIGCDESVYDYGFVKYEMIEFCYIMVFDLIVVFGYCYDDIEFFMVVGEQFIV